MKTRPPTLQTNQDCQPHHFANDDMNKNILPARLRALVCALTRTSVLALACAIEPALLAGSAHAQALQTDFEYDSVNNPTKVTDGLKRETVRGYDPLSRLKLITQPAPTPGAARPTIGFTYDGLDQLQTVTDPRNLITRYVVDGLAKRSLLTSPDTGKTSATYDSLGNLRTSLDARGVTTKIDYDRINRPTTITYGNAEYRFVYDQGRFAKGHLSGMVYPAGQTDFTYNSVGRLLSKSQRVVQGGETKTFTIGYEYGKSGSANGHLTATNFPSGNRVEYAYDRGGRINSLTLIPANHGAPVPLLRDIGYLPFGPAQSWVWGNSSDSQRNTYAKSFDLAGRVKNFPLGNAFNQGVLRTLSYDAGNRIRKAVDTGIMSPTQVTQTFDYDDQDHLTEYGDGNNRYGYKYDASGNRTQSTINGTDYPYAIDPVSNRFKGMTINGHLFGVGNDAAGNQKKIFNSTAIIFYGPTGRIESVYDNTTNSSANYFYNTLGERLNTGTSYYLHDQNGRLVGEYNLDGSAMEETVFLGNQPVAVLKPDGAGGTQVYYVYADHLNTPRWITRALDDKVVWRWDVAEPFGASLPDENPGGLGQFVYNRRFPGQVYDGFLGVNYNYFRDYDPQTGRYITSDPIGLAGGLNTYGYVGGAPLSLIDPYGLSGHLNLLEDGGDKGSQSLYDWAESYRPPYLNTIKVHGNHKGQFMSSDRVGYAARIYPSGIARLLTGAKGYDPNLATRLVACKSGIGGEESGAQEIANELYRHGNPHGVWAPIGSLVQGEVGQMPEAAMGHRYGWILVMPNIPTKR